MYSRSYFDYKPKYVVNYGTAGSLNKNISGLIEVSKFYQRDMDVRGLGFELGQTPFENDFFVQLDKNGYSCGTGDSFVMTSPDLITDIVDMEAYSYAKFCKINKLNFISSAMSIGFLFIGLVNNIATFVDKSPKSSFLGVVRLNLANGKFRFLRDSLISSIRYFFNVLIVIFLFRSIRP